MRGRASDPDLWGDLYDRFRRADDPPPRRARRGLPPESSARLIDAALGILGSVRTFVDVAEDLLLERRDGTHDPSRPEPWVRDGRVSWAHDANDRHDEDSVVRDIPLHGA